jgi:hypothetical protein
MTPTEYRQFCESTYCAPSTVDREEYLRLLLIEEVGEVASLFAKSMRDGHEVDRDRLLKELGDVMWAAVMMDDASKSHVTLWRNYTYADMSDIFISILTYVAFSDACEMCLACGFDPKSVALANVAKLKSRQARGVLHGSGDER